MSVSLNPTVKDAAIPAAINAVIDGMIAYSSHGGRNAVPISVDSIASTEATVGSEAAMIALTLAVILTLITAAIFRKGVAARHPEARELVSRPLFPSVVGIALQNALMLFGATVVAAVLWQRTVGTVMVVPAIAAGLVALFAGLVTVVVDLRTRRALLRPAETARV